MSKENQTTSTKYSLAIEWAVLLLIIAGATVLRYWKIGEVPPGFNSDEAVGAIGALTTLREGIQYAYEGQGGGGALGFYFAAVAFYLFGPSIETIRGLAAWAGVVSIFANYWAVRELFRLEGLTKARLIAGLATLGLAVSLWHVTASRIAFAGIGVPFLMLPSIYFLWLGLNNPQRKWPFLLSGIFLGGLMYIYLSGVFVPPLYAAFFISQALIVWVWRWADRGGERDVTASAVEPLHSKNSQLTPNHAYMTSQFWNLFLTAAVATVLLLPIVYVLLTRPEADPSTTRVSQAFFMNERISQGDPWGLLWRSFEGNFAAYGVSLDWLWGQTPRLEVFIPPQIGLTIFIGFLICLGQGLRGRAAYLFVWLWYGMLLLPSILSPDAIPHNLRTIGATTPTYIFMAVTIVTALDLLYLVGQWTIRFLIGQKLFRQTAQAVAALLLLGLTWHFWSLHEPLLNHYFYVYPRSDDAKAAYHMYAVEIAGVINGDDDARAAYILPRNTAAGETFRNFTTDFLVELEQPLAAHFWVVDDERTLAADLTEAAANHSIIRIVRWKTSKHTGADPKEVMPYYLEKYGHFDDFRSYGYFDIETYELETTAPDFTADAGMQSAAVRFGSDGGLRLTAYGFGNAGDVSQVDQPTAQANDLLWARLDWQLEQPTAENLKSALMLFDAEGQLISQIDKLLQSNILQVGTAEWLPDTAAAAYYLVPIPPATPPGEYHVRLAIYGETSQTRLPLVGETQTRVAELGTVRITPSTEPVDLDTLSLTLPVGQEILPNLTLHGFEALPPETVRSGERLAASIIWQAGEQPPSTDVQVSLLAQASEGEQTWSLSDPVGLAGRGYPTSAWQAGEMLRGWLRARIPPMLESGEYKLSLRFNEAGAPDDALLILPIGDFQIEGWPRQFDPPQPSINLEADFNQQAILNGADVATAAVTPGATLNVTLHWQAVNEFDEDYTAFVHLINNEAGALYGQADQTPGGGAYPTTGWLSGEYLRDEYTLTVSETAPVGEYRLLAGMYNPRTGERLPLQCGLPVCDTANRAVTIGTVTVE